MYHHREKVEKIKNDPKLCRKIIELERKDVLEQFDRLKSNKNDTLDEWYKAKDKMKSKSIVQTSVKIKNKLF